jgi:hypothetical protein
VCLVICLRSGSPGDGRASKRECYPARAGGFVILGVIQCDTQWPIWEGSLQSRSGASWYGQVVGIRPGEDGERGHGLTNLGYCLSNMVAATVKMTSRETHLTSKSRTWHAERAKHCPCCVRPCRATLRARGCMMHVFHAHEHRPDIDTIQCRSKMLS